MSNKYVAAGSFIGGNRKSSNFGIDSINEREDDEILFGNMNI
jgi:hypothetical protein